MLNPEFKKFYIHVNSNLSDEEIILTVFCKSLDEATEHADRYYGERVARVRPHVSHDEV